MGEVSRRRGVGVHGHLQDQVQGVEARGGNSRMGRVCRPVRSPRPHRGSHGHGASRVPEFEENL